MAAMLSVNVYNSIVDARSWSANIPDSILTARNYFKTVNPGTFFRTASPFNQILALAAVVACWKSGRKVRLYFGLAFLLAVLTDALTFAYFYPRNEILFRAAQSNADVFTKICSEWSTMNWVRSIILAFGLVCSMKGLDAYYVKAQPRTKAKDDVNRGLDTSYEGSTGKS
jgi:uncharacterized membrane protein